MVKKKKHKRVEFPRQYKSSVFMDWLIKNWIKDYSKEYIKNLLESELIKENKK